MQQKSLSRVGSAVKIIRKRKLSRNSNFDARAIYLAFKPSGSESYSSFEREASSDSN